jgi:hypothetical protein
LSIRDVESVKRRTRYRGGRRTSIEVTMSDAPKSAWEIALQKLQKQDRERGETGPASLSAGQKKSIAEIRARFQARLAEAEILHRSNQAKAAGDAEALEKLEEEFRIERRRIDDQREREIAKTRSGGGRGAKKKG